jgi:hypothetical protein
MDNQEEMVLKVLQDGQDLQDHRVPTGPQEKTVLKVL